MGPWRAEFVQPVRLGHIYIWRAHIYEVGTGSAANSDWPTMSVTAPASVPRVLPARGNSQAHTHRFWRNFADFGVNIRKRGAHIMTGPSARRAGPVCAQTIVHIAEVHSGVEKKGAKVDELTQVDCIHLKLATKLQSQASEPRASFMWLYLFGYYFDCTLSVRLGRAGRGRQDAAERFRSYHYERAHATGRPSASRGAGSRTSGHIIETVWGCGEPHSLALLCMPSLESRTRGPQKCLGLCVHHNGGHICTAGLLELIQFGFWPPLVSVQVTIYQ